MYKEDHSGSKFCLVEVGYNSVTGGRGWLSTIDLSLL